MIKTKRLSKNKFIWIMAILLIIPVAYSLTAQNLNYDLSNNEVNITYDNLNRILTKNTSSTNYSYTYDAQYQGTLTNISFGNNSIKYTYDTGLRIIEESRVIDGIEFKKNYYYDSSDRIIRVTFSSGQSIEYFYNKQGQIDKIANVINATKHNPLDKPLNRTYANNLTTNFSYDSQTLRLIEIKTSDIQKLAYTYDSVGNIIAINDSPNNRSQVMTYDSLDRLLSMSINGKQNFIYSYNSIGNILKIVRYSKNTTIFIYGTKPVHAPSQIIIGDSGSDVQKSNVLYANGNTRVISFNLVNENNASFTTNWTVNTGDNVISSNTPIDFVYNDSILVIVENNYTSPKDYSVNISSQSDYTNVSFKLGVRATALSILNITLSDIFYRLLLWNDYTGQLSGDWNCSASSASFILSSNASLINISEYNYSSPGQKAITCTTPNDTRTVDFVIKGIRIENVSHTIIVENRRNISFDIRNYYNPLTVSYNISSDGQSYSGTSTVNNVTRINQEINYTTDGLKTIIIRINATNTSDVYNETFIIRSLRIENYTRTNSSITTTFKFNIKNYWPQDLSVSWNMSDPSYVNSSFTITSNSSVSVLYETNYTEGIKRPEINAYSSQFKDTIVDNFIIKPLQIIENQISYENASSGVMLYLIKSLGNQRNISWNLDNGVQNISSNLPIPINNYEEIFMIIESSYNTNGVYAYTYKINSSSNNDNISGVVIIG